MSALAKLYKAMALGSLIQTYEEVPIDISVEGPVPQPRAAVLTEILTLLEGAKDDTSLFTSKIARARWRGQPRWPSQKPAWRKPGKCSTKHSLRLSRRTLRLPGI